MSYWIDRRTFLASTAGAAAAGTVAKAGLSPTSIFAGESAGGARLSKFSVDVTVPFGHALMGGGIAPASSLADPLWARGIVLEGAGPTLVLAAVDWCEIRNDAYDAWRKALARAAQTTPDNVLLTSVHQHDAPVADLRAEAMLRERKLAGSVCDPSFHEQTVAKVAEAVVAARQQAQRVTHLGTGQAQVERVASNRRYHAADGQVRYDRMSATRDAAARAAEIGTIDPWLKTVSFWDEERPLAALSFYATHPMSSYGQGAISCDFVGLARRRRQEESPAVQQMYFSGCSGNVTAGKYNDGAPLMRAELTDRIYQAMTAAWKATQRRPLNGWQVRHAPLELAPRASEGFTQSELEAQLTPAAKPFDQCLAAMGLSWRERLSQGRQLVVPAADFGGVQILVLPGESYVEYQLFAQQVRPDDFVAVAGYGECATGYIPIERAWEEKDGNLHDWCWVAPGSQARMESAIRVALGAK